MSVALAQNEAANFRTQTAQENGDEWQSVERRVARAFEPADGLYSRECGRVGAECLAWRLEGVLLKQGQQWSSRQSGQGRGRFADDLVELVLARTDKV